MPRTPAGMRECPTRADGARALFAHVIDLATCQERQRGHYHKCPTCAFGNARNGHALPLVALNGFARNGQSHEPAPRVPIATPDDGDSPV